MEPLPVQTRVLYHKRNLATMANPYLKVPTIPLANAPCFMYSGGQSSGSGSISARATSYRGFMVKQERAQQRFLGREMGIYAALCGLLLFGLQNVWGQGTGDIVGT